MPLSLMHRQYIPSARMVIFFLLLLLATGVARAATFGVTTPGQQTLTNRFLPYAGSGTQLIGNSPAWRDSAGVLGINNYLEGLETLTPAAAVNLNFSTWRTKRITLNQNTVFTAINIPSASTNVQTMLLEVIGDGVFTVSFANVTWQTPEITTPEAGVVTLYALRGDSGAVKGYTQAVAASGVTTINPTDGYLPYRSNATTFADSPWYRIAAATMGFNGTNNFLFDDPARYSMGMGQLTFAASGNATEDTAFGYNALTALTTGDQNSAFGAFSLAQVQGGSGNSGFGHFTLNGNIAGDDNTAVGMQTLIQSTGSFNTAVGRDAGYTLTTGIENSLFGAYTFTQSATDTNSIVIGANVTGNGSNTTVIGNTNTVSAHIIATGYAGTGANFLSDDGTYKTAGGGSPLWASSSGNLTPSPAVDVVSIQSQSADSATNIALRVNSTATWTNSTAYLIAGQNNSTNVFLVTPRGAIGVGNASDVEAIAAEDIAIFEASKDISRDPTGATAGEIWLQVRDSDSFNSYASTDTYIDGSLDAASAQLGLQAHNTNSAVSASVTLFAKPLGSYISIVDFARNLALLSPSIADGSTPFRLDPSLTHTSGNLLEVANNNTNKMTVDYLGNVTANGFIAGATNAVGELANKVTGAASSTDNDLMTFSSTSGKLAKVSTSAATLGDNSSATVVLTGNVSGTDTTLTFGSGTLVSSGSLEAAAGTLGSPAIRMGGDTATGLWRQSANRVAVSINGVENGMWLAGEYRLNGSTSIGWSPAAPSVAVADTVILRDSAARFQQGLDAAAVVSPQIFGTADGTGTDKAGATKILAAGRSTGTGRPGDLSLTTGSTTTTSGSGVNADSTRFYAVSKAVDLTESAATAFQKFTLATNNYAGMEIVATVRASDAAFAFQSLTTTMLIDAVNVGGTNAVTINPTSTNTVAQIPVGGTLTCTYDAIDEGSNVFSIRANAVSSLTQTALRIKWVITALNSSDAITVTPQP